MTLPLFRRVVRIGMVVGCLLVAAPSAAQMSFDTSAYADGGYDGYDANGNATLYYWGNGLDNSNPGGGGCYHDYGFYLEVRRVPEQQVVAQVYGATGASGEASVTPATYEIEALFAIWCSCFLNWVSQAGAQQQVEVPPIPSGEITNSNGWLNGGIHNFVQTLLPTSTNFYGRQVTEFVGGEGTDTCWFPGSLVPPQTTITGGSWSVQASNVWGPDQVGWEESGINYYRQQGRAPCGAFLIQGMMIDTPIGNREYVVHVLEASFTSTTVTSARAEESVTHTWP